MSTPVSALASAASGTGSLLSGVSNLLPTTTSQSGSYKNSASATSDTVGLQGNISDTSVKGSETSTTKKNSVQDILSSLVAASRSTESVYTSNVENFSGQQNSSVQQTLLTDPAVMRIVNLMLQGDGGIAGLQQVASGERNAGVYNSSTNQLLVNNLLTTVAGEVARLSAPVVTNQNVGASSTTQKGQSTLISDAIQNQTGRTATTESGSQQSATAMTQDTLSELISLALQSTDQASESEGTSSTKTKTKKFPSAVGFIVFGLMGATAEHPVYASVQKFAKHELNLHEKVEYYRFSKRLSEHLQVTPVSEWGVLLNELNGKYITPAAQFYSEGDIESARVCYKELITVV